MTQPRSFDLEEIVKNWAWKQYDRTATWRQKRLRRNEERSRGSYIGVHIDWSEVSFFDETHWGKIAQGTFDDLDSSSDSNENKSLDVEDATSRPDKVMSHANILFQTKFTNNTNDEQEYTMKTEKTTSSICTTEVESGYTKGYEMSVTLKTPCEVLEASAGFHREMSLNRIEGEEIEETLSWGVESQIRVKRGHIAEAQMVVNEKKVNGNFTVVTKMKGLVIVNFNNIRSKNSLIKSTAHDISEIVAEFLDMERRKGQPLDFVTIDKNVVIMKTKGTCRFRFGVKQEVRVDQVPIKEN